MIEPRAGKAFTLIELLVAIAVIGVLMGLLVPVATRVRAAGHATACRGNLRQMGEGLSLYMEEHRDYIPRRGQGERKVWRIDRPSDWFNALLPYVDSPPYYELYTSGRRPVEGDPHVFICPAAQDPGWHHFFPYAMNMCLSPWIRDFPHNLRDISSPSTLVFMADAPGPYCSTLPSSQPYSVSPRHAGSANLVFLDGHAQGFEGAALGCGAGDPKRGDVCWQVDCPGVNYLPRD